MGSALLPASFVRLHAQSVRRTCIRLSAASVTSRSPAHQTSTSRTLASEYRSQRLAAARGSAAYTSSFGSVKFHLQLAARPYAGTRVQAMRTAIVAAHSSAPMQRKVSHILVRADQPEILDEIEERLADGEDFKLLAAEFSDCRSRLKGGASGWVDKGQTAPTFEEAVFEASIGELVRAETHHGLHLIRVEAERKQEGIVQMSVTDLSKILKDPEQKAQYQFVDVREPAEETTANIKEFQLFPLSKLREWGPSIKLNLDPGKPTVVMCHHGVRSQQAAQYLEAEGFAQLNNVKGGIHEYSVTVDSSVPVY